MALVIDASIAIAWCLRDRDSTAEADTVMNRVLSEAAIVLGLFWYETRSVLVIAVLVIAERKGRIEADATERHMNRLRNLPLLTDNDQDDRQTVALARRHNLGGYDAAYVETAKRRSAELATLDQKLAAVAASEGISYDVD